MVAVLVILTIAVFVLADAILQWKEEDVLKRVPAPKEVKPAPPDVSFAFEGMRIPAGVFHDRGHTWVEIQPSGAAHVGMDVFSQRLLGRLRSVELPETGCEIHRGEPLFTVHKDGRQATFLSPLDGNIESVNGGVAENPDKLSEDPYGENWFCRVQPASLSRALKMMTVAESASSWLKSEIKRFQAFLSVRPAEHVTLGALLQDGGQPVEGLLEFVDRQTWYAFEKKFLHTSERARTAA